MVETIYAYVGSGKKYKNCCLNKNIQKNFTNEQYPDCIEEDDSRMFFVLRDFLLDYTNKKYNINDELEDCFDIHNSEPEEVQEIREKLWSDKSIIKEYIKENPDDISEDILQELENWNEKKLKGKFTLYKYEKEYAVLLGEKNIYYVKGLKDTIRNLVSKSELPACIETVLLPFKGQIIYDSYILQYSVSFGNGIKDIFDKQYNDFIKKKKVKYQL